MQRTLCTTLSLALMAACAPQPEIRPVFMRDEIRQQSAAGNDYGVGKEHLAAGRLGLAVEHFRSAVARNGRDLAALNALAVCYDRLGRFDLADSYYDRALAQAPADPQTLNNLAISNLMRGRAARAVALLEKAGREAPGDNRIAANLTRASASAETRVATDAGQEEADPPSRLQRAGLNVWQLRAHAEAVPTSWTVPAAGQGEEPPLPMAAPRPAVERTSLDAPQPVSVEKARVQVVNGVGRRGMARRVGSLLSRHGLKASATDAPRFDVARSVLSYHPSHKADAERLSRLLPATVHLEADKKSSHDLVPVLGRDFVLYDQRRDAKGS